MVTAYSEAVTLFDDNISGNEWQGRPDSHLYLW